MPTTGGQAETYTYDANGNSLIQAVTTTGGLTNKTLGYAYDADGHRIEKTEDGVTTQYLVDRNRDYAQVIQE